MVVSKRLNDPKLRATKLGGTGVGRHEAGEAEDADVVSAMISEY
jgi:hypothetical protein